MKRSMLSSVWVAAVALLAVACANQKEPAQQALAGATSALSAAESMGAAKYLPDGLATVKTQVTELKTAFDAKDYAAVLKAAPGVLGSVQELIGATTARKDSVLKRANAEWPVLAAAVPGLLKTVQSRIDVLGKSRSAPAGVDLATAKGKLAVATSLWEKAQAASGAGNVEDAAEAARGAQDGVEAAAAALNLKLPSK